MTRVTSQLGADLEARTFTVRVKCPLSVRALWPWWPLSLPRKWCNLVNRFSFLAKHRNRIFTRKPNIPETNIILYVNYTGIKKENLINTMWKFNYLASPEVIIWALIIMDKRHIFWGFLKCSIFLTFLSQGCLILTPVLSSIAASGVFFLSKYIELIVFIFLHVRHVRTCSAHNFWVYTYYLMTGEWFIVRVRVHVVNGGMSSLVGTLRITQTGMQKLHSRRRMQ